MPYDPEPELGDSSAADEAERALARLERDAKRIEARRRARDERARMALEALRRGEGR